MGEGCTPNQIDYKIITNMDSINRLQHIWAGLARNNYAAYVDENDISSFIRRSGREGSEFYARGLASLRSDLLNGIETGQLTIKARFGKKRGTSLPRFLFTAWHAIFTEDGKLRSRYDNPSSQDEEGNSNGYFIRNWVERPDLYQKYMDKGGYDAGAVSCLNQLLAVFSKIKGGHTPESEVRCLNQFITCEEEIAATELDMGAKVGSRTLAAILYLASQRVRRVLAKACPSDIMPCHGSGVSACGLQVRHRYQIPRYVRAIDRVWPMSEYYFASPTHLCDKLDEWLQTDEEYVPVAKTLLVDKDARGPRIISCEPRETMFVQQGLMCLLYKTIERHPMTRGSVNFTDQTHNQRAAIKGSKDRKTATLDLSEASDRLRLDVVDMLFPPNWRAALNACRSVATRFPDGRVVPLLKHAPMGSAVCFPVMALSIWAVLSATLPRNCKILVYGDDIVVPAQHAELAVSVLELIGLKVNKSKSYVQGPFRESCGIEAISGLDITPVRLRANPEDNSDARARTIAFANNLFEKYGTEQCWMTKFIHEWYVAVPERTHDPRVGEVVATSGVDHLGNAYVSRATIMNKTLCGVLNVTCACNTHLRVRWNKRLQRREYRYLHVQPVEVKYLTGDWCHLFRALVNPRTRRPLGVDALSKRVSYKYRWTGWLS